jgi:hypothetical protein
MIYRIYPPIGIARVGNSPDAFFIGPETPGSLGTEIVAGVERPVADFKDSAFRMKRQAARSACSSSTMRTASGGRPRCPRARR